MKQYRSLVLMGIALLTFGATAWSAEAMTAAALKAEIVKLMEADIDAATIASYVQEHPLSAPLSADEIIEWKKAGISEGMIKRTMENVEKKNKESLETKEPTRTINMTAIVPLASTVKKEIGMVGDIKGTDAVPLDVKLNPSEGNWIEFRSTFAIVDSPRNGTQTLTIVVMGINLGKTDYFGIVNATLLDDEGKALSSKNETKSLEEKDPAKPIKIVFTGLTEKIISSVKKYKLDFSAQKN